MNNSLSQIKPKVESKEERKKRKKKNLCSGVCSNTFVLYCFFMLFLKHFCLCSYLTNVTGNEGSIAERVNDNCCFVYRIRIGAGHKHGLQKQNGENGKPC